MPRRKNDGVVDIETLDAITQIRLRPQMHMGETTSLTHLWFEVIDNACDECLCGYADTIEVKFDNGWYIVRDNGRGIPLTSPKMPGAEVPVEICTQIYSGGKFRKNMYDFSTGLHGVGLTLVNALSTEMRISTKNGEDKYSVYHFVDAKYVNKDIIDRTDEDRWSTEIAFKPDPKYFDRPDCIISEVENRLMTIKFGLRETIKVIYNDKEVLCNLMDGFLGNIEDYVEETFVNKANESCTLVIGITELDKGKEFRGIVNLLQSNDGTHQRSVFGIFKDKLFEIATKRKLHLSTADDVLAPIKILCMLRIKETAFAGQTKGRLATKRELIDPLVEKVVDSIIKKNPEFIDKILEQAELYRISLENKRSVKKHTNGRNVMVKGLKDCQAKNVDERIIYLLEGESAGGSLIKCRDPYYHAVLALRGKILNVSKEKKARIMSSEVVETICNSLGLRPFQPVDLTKCRYGEIHIAADADPDGQHITALLTIFFLTLFPELIKACKFFVVHMALF